MTDQRESTGETAVAVHAEMVGTVFRVLVSVGDVVEKGAELVVLESMKMEVPVIAPRAGTVSSIAAVEGARVPEGDLLVLLSATD